MSGEAIVAEARKLIGSKYLFGGQSPDGFDSAGLVVYVFKKVAQKTLPHVMGDLVNQGKKVTKKNLKPGDLIFINQSHVGIYSGEGKYIHSKKMVGVKEDTFKKFYSGRRIL